MENEDSRNALYCDPNAYIQRFEKKEKHKPRKVVFQEPYEQLPNFYINNNFTKHNCDCVSNNQNYNNNSNANNRDCNCNHGNSNYNQRCYCDNHNNKSDRNQFGYTNRDYYCNHDDNCHNGNLPKQSGFGFDLKSLLPLMSLFNKGGGADLSQIVGLLNNTNNSQNGNNSNPMNLISNLMSNKDAMSGILNLFKGGGLNLFNKKQTTKKELKTTDFEIKNYTRVE